MRAMAKDRSRRYDTPNSLARDIERFLASEPIHARPPSFRYKAGRFVRRHRVGVAFAATLLLALLGLATTMVVQARRIAAERDRANQEAEVANAALQFMTELFEISDPGEARGNSITAREVLDTGAERIEESLRDQPEIQSRLMSTIGTVYHSLGLYQAAEEPLRSVLEIRRRRFGNEHPDVAEALDDLGSLLRRRAEYDAAEALYREALTIRRALYGDEHRDIATSLNLIGTVLYRKGDYAASEPLMRDALAMAERLLDRSDADFPTHVNGMGNVLIDMGRPDEAVPFYRESLQLRRTLHGGDHPQIAFALDNLAMALDEAGKDDEAEPLYFESLAMLRRIYGEEHPEIAQTLGNVSVFLENTGDYGRAETMVQEALELNRKLLGDAHPMVADNIVTLASLAELQGAPERGESLINEALAIYREALPEGHPKILSAENLHGLILAALGRYQEAEPLMIRSHEGLSPTDSDGQWRAGLEDLIAFYEDWGKPDEAAKYRAELERPR